LPAGIPTKTPALSPAIDNADFALAWSGSITKKDLGARELNVTLMIKNANAWKSDPTAQSTLRANFDDFCRKVEDLELGQKVLIEGGAALLIRRLAEALPVPLSESLYYHAGFNTGLGLGSAGVYATLRSGMRLRVETAANQFVAPGSPLNGLVGSGQFFYQLGRARDGRLTFDAFLAAIAAPRIATPPGQAVASSLVDLAAAGSARRHYRLFYPAELAAASSAGSARPEQNITLLGADTLADIQAATSAWLEAGEIALVSAAPVVAVALRGRTIAVPEIRIYVNRRISDKLLGEALYVPLGTTMRQLLDHQLPLWHPRTLLEDNDRCVLRRLWSEDDGVPVYRTVRFNAASNDDDKSVDPATLDLPLLAGDRLDIKLNLD
jgi:hypothetical protein